MRACQAAAAEPKLHKLPALPVHVFASSSCACMSRFQEGGNATRKLTRKLGAYKGDSNSARNFKHVLRPPLDNLAAYHVVPPY